MRKKFDRTLHKEHDKKARMRTMEFMQIKGYEVWENPNEYGQDLIAEGSKGKFFVECEVKTVWRGDTFPFDSYKANFVFHMEQRIVLRYDV